MKILCTIILCHYLATLIPSNICRSNASSIILIVKITILRHIAQRVVIIGNQIYLCSYGRGIVVCLQISTACTFIQLLCHLFCRSEMPQLAVRQGRLGYRSRLSLLFNDGIVFVITQITCHCMTCCIKIIFVVLPCLENWLRHDSDCCICIVYTIRSTYLRVDTKSLWCCRPSGTVAFVGIISRITVCFIVIPTLIRQKGFAW